MKRKIHFHTDCAFFAGCENMLSVLLNSDDFNKYNIVSFSYRYSPEYKVGYEKRVKRRVPVYPLNFFSFSNIDTLPKWMPILIRRIILKSVRIMLEWPLLICETVALVRLLKRIAPNILHINNGGYPAALSPRAAAIAGKIAGVPKIVMVINSQAADYSSVPRWLDYPLDRLVVRSVDLFITGSNSAKARLESVLTLSQGKARAIFNGIAMRDGSYNVSATRARLKIENKPYVIFGVVALLIPRKGHAVLLDAVRRILCNDLLSKNFIVLIEGDGPLRSDLIRFVQKHRLNEHVRFIGVESNIFDFISAIDVLVLSSIEDEDFPNVILEAMSLGKPVIASRLAGIPEQVINNVTGILVEPKNADMLAFAMARIIDDRQIIELMGRRAFDRFINHFTEWHAVNSYLEMYNELYSSSN